jgi:hypothetical protein
MAASAAEFGGGHDGFAVHISPSAGDTIPDAEQAQVASVIVFLNLHFLVFGLGVIRTSRVSGKEFDGFAS